MNARKIGQKRHQHDLDGYEYVMRMPGTSRSGRKVKPKVYNDGTVSLVGCVDESGMVGKPLQARVGTNADSPRHSSAEDCQSPIARELHGRIVGEVPQVKKLMQKNGGGIFKAAAVSVLREDCRLMTTGEITKAAIQRGFIKCSGKTPEATMASALYTDIKRRTGESIFVRPREGLFGLREWIGQSNGFSLDERNGKKLEEQHGYSTEISNKKESKKGNKSRKDSHCAHAEGADTVGQTVGSTNELTNIVQYPMRDGLIDLLSAAEKVNNGNSEPLKRKRKVLITAVSRPREAMKENQAGGPQVYCEAQKSPHIRSPWNRRKPERDRRSNDALPDASVGEKGSVVCVKREDSLDENREDACVQSPQANHMASEDLGAASWSKHDIRGDTFSDNDLKGQLQFLRYCVQNPNNFTRIQAEHTLSTMEEALFSHGQRMPDEEQQNNSWIPQEDIFVGSLCHDEKITS